MATRIDEEEPCVYATAILNMTVFDHAPARVKERVQADGDAALVKWWNGLDQWNQLAILERAEAEAQRLSAAWGLPIAD